MNTNALDSAVRMSDSELLARVKTLAANERHATAQLVAHLAEVDSRRLYLGEGCSSLFTYCTQVLHLSEHAAYGRIEAARAARKFPAVLDALADGSLHITSVTLVAPHLTHDNVERVIAAATHKTKREVEHLVAVLHPQPPVPSSVRKLPAPKHDVKGEAVTPDAPLLSSADVLAELSTATSRSGPSESPSVPSLVQPAPRAQISPRSTEQYLVKFTASRATHDKLQEARALLRHQIPSGDVAEIFDRALTLLVTELRKARYAATTRPRSQRNAPRASRHIPAAVRRAVWARDGGQCAFVGAAGRCTEQGFLEYHHLVPFTDGGQATVENIQLRCRAHNGFEAEAWFGPREEDLVREAGPIYGASCGENRELAGHSTAGAGWSMTRSRTEFGEPAVR